VQSLYKPSYEELLRLKASQQHQRCLHDSLLGGVRVHGGHGRLPSPARRLTLIEILMLPTRRAEYPVLQNDVGDREPGSSLGFGFRPGWKLSMTNR
jgi:hypothetical protein